MHGCSDNQFCIHPSYYHCRVSSSLRCPCKCGWLLLAVVSCSLLGSGKWRVMKVNDSQMISVAVFLLFFCFFFFFCEYFDGCFLLFCFVVRVDVTFWQLGKIFIEIMKETVYTLCTIIIKINWLTIKLPSLICFLKTKETGTGNVMKLQFHFRPFHGSWKWLCCYVATLCLNCWITLFRSGFHSFDFFDIDFWSIFKIDMSLCLEWLIISAFSTRMNWTGNYFSTFYLLSNEIKSFQKQHQIEM